HEELVEPDFIDLIIVPCLAVDAEGNRLGYGKGYYDRLLARMGLDIPRIALAFEHQVAYPVPITTHDQPVSIIITDKRILRHELS
ncbi:MAG: 5-formyltetrahydrofolate cyclo-ligase, partial [Promethearchaeota archaeon]